MKSRMLMAAVPLLVLLAAPPVATADTDVRAEQVDGLDVVVARDGDAGATIEAELGQTEEGVHYVAVRNTDGVTTPGGACDATAEVVACEGDYDAIVVFGNGGNDEITLRLISSGLPPLHGDAWGGQGNDTLKAPPLNGDDQPSSVLAGEDGDDTLLGGNGDDEVRGGAGNDSVSGGVPGTDIVDGGPGFDSIPDGGGDYSRAFGSHTLTISLDGVANDGEAGENDNVLGVEKLSARADVVTLTGDNGPNDLFVEAGSSTLRGLGGDDRLVTYDGNDTIEGGDGNDFIEAGFGNDVLDGGAGVDQFSGDRTESNVFAVGNDEIRARDGNAEQVGCGIGGGDRAIVDANDVVASDCEAIDRLQINPPPPPPGKPGKPKLTGKKTLRALLRRGLTVQVRCPAACAVRAELRLGKKVVARGRKTLKAAGTAKVKVKVVKKARKRLKKLKRAKVTLRTRTVIAGVTTPGSRKVTLKR